MISSKNTVIMIKGSTEEVFGDLVRILISIRNGMGSEIGYEDAEKFIVDAGITAQENWVKSEVKNVQV